MALVKLVVSLFISESSLTLKCCLNAFLVNGRYLISFLLVDLIPNLNGSIEINPSVNNTIKLSKFSKVTKALYAFR